MVIADEVLSIRVTILVPVGANAFDEDASADRKRMRDDFICIYLVGLSFFVLRL